MNFITYSTSAILFKHVLVDHLGRIPLFLMLWIEFYSLCTFTLRLKANTVVHQIGSLGRFTRREFIRFLSGHRFINCFIHHPLTTLVPCISALVQSRMDSTLLGWCIYAQSVPPALNNSGLWSIDQCIQFIWYILTLHFMIRHHLFGGWYIWHIFITVFTISVSRPTPLHFPNLILLFH